MLGPRSVVDAAQSNEKSSNVNCLLNATDRRRRQSAIVDKEALLRFLFVANRTAPDDDVLQ